MARPVVPAVALAALLALAVGCAGRSPAPPEQLLQPMVRKSAVTPLEADLAGARLAAAALASDRKALELAWRDLVVAEAEDTMMLERLMPKEKPVRPPQGPRARQDARRGEEEGPTEAALMPIAMDVVNSTLDDTRAYGEATERVLARHDVDPALEERLKRALADDPLRLARRRDLDHMSRRFAYHFNAISAPLGRALMSGVVMAPYQIAIGGAQYLAGILEMDPISVQERQALAHRKYFLRKNPESPKAEGVHKEVVEDESVLRKFLGGRRLVAARNAIKMGRPNVAVAYANQALNLIPNDKGALAVRDAARLDLDNMFGALQKSVSANHRAPTDLEVSHERTRDVAEALLLSSPDLVARTRALARADKKGVLSDEIEFILALAQYEAGYEDRSWDRLRGLAKRRANRSNMARHASALLRDPWQNPWGEFKRARGKGRRKMLISEALGPFARGPRFQKLPKPIAYLIDAPAMGQTLLMAPVRAFFSIGKDRKEFQRASAVAAYRYLGKNPRGQHRREALDWLYDFESERGNWPAALRVADFQPGFDSIERTELAERAAESQLRMAERIGRRDRRGSVLRSLVQEFPDSVAGHHAGHIVRFEAENVSAQRIRMTRGFLRENPEVAGHEGLGVRRELLDGDTRNGELHPNGVTFLGGQWLEFAMIEGGRTEDDPPEKVQRRVSAERLARAVSALDERSRLTARLDPDGDLHADARRDLFIERARLGLTERPDPRPTAESTYVFESVRERYGMVRGRSESILPFDLVLQGSFTDMGLGAFPRWRPPKETPDAFLYR